MQRLARYFFLAAPLALAGLAACGRSERHPDVLLILVDTLRADRLGAWGSERPLTPAIDTLLSEGRVCGSAFAHAPWTLPSTASLLTSLQPEQHGAGGVVPHRDQSGRILGGFTALAEGIPTLAERFAAAGYRTGAIVNVDFLGKNFGLTRGFEHVDEVHFADNDHVRDARATTDAALAWLGLADERPSFLLVHYFDAHAVYDPPPAERRAWALGPDKEDASFHFPTREQMVLLRQGRLALTPELIARAEALYDGEVAFIDSQVGRLLEQLDRSGKRASTLIAFTADHGEEFLDHGGFEHGHSLYDELLHVPLAFSWPGHVPAGRSEEAVGLIDVAPTLCELAGVAPGAGFLGRSLVSDWKGGPRSARSLLAHGNFWGPPLSSLRQAERKLILGPAGPAGGRKVELYDWRADPGERSDLAAREAARAQVLRQRLEETERLLEARRGSGVELDSQTFQRLKAQGYVGGDEQE